MIVAKIPNLCFINNHRRSSGKTDNSIIADKFNVDLDLQNLSIIFLKLQLGKNWTNVDKCNRAVSNMYKIDVVLVIVNVKNEIAL